MYPVTEAMSTPEFAQTQWYDYSRMSMIYVLYQLGLKSEVFPDALWEVTGRWCVEWTRRCRGYVCDDFQCASPWLFRRGHTCRYTFVL